MRGSLCIVVLCLLTLGVPHVTALPVHPVDPYDHPDVGIRPGAALAPSYEAVVDALDEHAKHPWVRLHDLGTSEEGRTIRYAAVTDPDSDVAMDQRVVTFIFTQQHGNEEAGTPAALRLLDEITAGDDIAASLSNQILLLLPMANPDGAVAGRRANAEGYDLNRDHIHLATRETRAIHTVLNDWPVHVAMDHHEFTGVGFGNPAPVRVYDYDLTTLPPEHGNVRAPVQAMAEALMYEGIWPAAREKGYTVNEYSYITADGTDLARFGGGPDPGKVGNHLGLHHVASLLVETRSDLHPNPFHDAMRRYDLQHTAMESAVRYVSEHAQAFTDARNMSLVMDAEAPFTHYLEGGPAPLAGAYAVPTANDTETTFTQHGLHPGFVDDDRVVHNVHDGHAGHVGALVHPDSSRAIAHGVPTAPMAHPEEAVPATIETTPAASMAALLVALLGMAGLQRWRSRL